MTDRTDRSDAAEYAADAYVTEYAETRPEPYDALDDEDYDPEPDFDATVGGHR